MFFFSPLHGDILQHSLKACSTGLLEDLSMSDEIISAHQEWYEDSNDGNA